MKGRKLSAAPMKGKGASKGGAGHTHIQAETPTTTAAETGVLDLQQWAGNRTRRVDADGEPARRRWT